MNDTSDRDHVTHETAAPASSPAGGRSAGKRTLTERAGLGARRDGPPWASTGGLLPESTARASAGAANMAAPPPGSLPYLDELLGSFGVYGVGGIRAHQGDAAARSADQLGAAAFATGDDIVLGADADLHTVAHEVTHVLQQRAGQVTRGDDAGHEQLADAVADRVVRGEPVADLLAPALGPPESLSASVDDADAPLQRKARRAPLEDKAAVLAPYFDEIHRVAAEVTALFAPVGLHFRPAILFAVVLQEADAKDPLGKRSFDDGLGLTQITPTHEGKLDDDVARAIGWDNDRGVEYNIAHSRWREAYPNLRAGANNLLLKAKRIKRLVPEVWDSMSEPQRWRASLFAYNAGEATAVRALKSGGPDAPMISRFRIKGELVSHDYTAEVDEKLGFADRHEAFGPKKSEAPETHDAPEKPAAADDAITASVGRGGKNLRPDVLAVQHALARHGIDPGPRDGVAGQRTLDAIIAIQRSFMARPDGVIDPGGETERHLRATELPRPQPRPEVRPPADAGESKHEREHVVPPGELPRVWPSVKLTPAIERAYRVLVPYLSSSVFLTSGLRSDADQERIILDYFTRRHGPATIADVEAKRQWLLQRGLKIARVGSSPHRTGLAFDLSGDAIDRMLAAVKRCAAEHPSDFHLANTIVERQQNCLHINLDG